jgi:hypothetical protein
VYYYGWKPTFSLTNKYLYLPVFSSTLTEQIIVLDFAQTLKIIIYLHGEYINCEELIAVENNKGKGNNYG